MRDVAPFLFPGFQRRTLMTAGERMFELLTTIMLLSFFLERALAVVFENRWFVARLTGKGAKEPLTVAVAFVICRMWHFDALSRLFGRDTPQFYGYLLTAAIVAGGSKASLKLFHDVFGAMSTAEQRRQQTTSTQAVSTSPNGSQTGTSSALKTS
jgi:hypothetical protein